MENEAEAIMAQGVIFTHMRTHADTYTDTKTHTTHDTRHTHTHIPAHACTHLLQRASFRLFIALNYVCTDMSLPTQVYTVRMYVHHTLL